MSTNVDLPPTPQPKKRRKRPNAFADHVREWESLLAAVSEHLETVAAVEAHRAALAESLEQVRQTKALQETHRANQQSTTQTLYELVAATRNRAIRLRGAIRAELGPTTAQLTQFGIRPLGNRPSRRKSQSGTTAATPKAIPERE